MEETLVVDRGDGSPTTALDPAPLRRRGRTALAVGAGLLVGLSAAVFLPGLLDGGDDVATPPVEQPGDAADPSEGGALADERAGAAEAAAPAGPAPEGAGAGSAEAAVTGFLDAEVAGDFEASFGYLSDDDRLAYTSPARWVASHADVIAPVLSYEVVQVDDADADDAEVMTDVRFEPGLDQVTGLTPAAARATWVVAEGEDGTWGVALDESTLAPTYPPAEGADEAAREWVGARLACEEPANEHPSLVGSPAVADALCDAAEPTLAAGEPLTAIDAQPVLNAYGQSTASAARLVQLSGPVDLGAVLVPIGDVWTVIAVVP